VRQIDTTRGARTTSRHLLLYKVVTLSWGVELYMGQHNFEQHPVWGRIWISCKRTIMTDMKTGCCCYRTDSFAVPVIPALIKVPRNQTVYGRGGRSSPTFYADDGKDYNRLPYRNADSRAGFSALRWLFSGPVLPYHHDSSHTFPLAPLWGFWFSRGIGRR
jgi:hypothetical protein